MSGLTEQPNSTTLDMGGSIHPFLPYAPGQCRATKPSSDTGGRWQCTLPDAHKGGHRFLDSSIPNESDLDRTTLQDALRVCEDKAREHRINTNRLHRERMLARAFMDDLPEASALEDTARKDAATFGTAADCLRDCLEALA